MRYSAFIAVAVFGLLSCQPSAEAPDERQAAFLDPVAADGEHYALEFENEYVRVLRENLSAGEGGAMHSHRDRVSVYLNDSGVTLTPRGGEPVEATLVAGTTSWADATTHQGVARGDIENLSIELQELHGPDLPAPELDAVAVDSDHHTVDFENARVRVVRMTYPAGSTTPRHAHRAGFGVALTRVHVQNITEEGELAIDYEPRSTFWTEKGPPHVTKNLRDEELVIVLVELKKQPS